MQTTKVLLLVLLGLPLLSACRTERGPNPVDDEGLHLLTTADPAMATSIMADFGNELSAFVPKGSSVVVVADPSDMLAQALGQSLTAHGYQLKQKPGADPGSIELAIWSAGVDGHVLVQFKTASHRLSKAYQPAKPTGDGGEMTSASQTMTAAGPLLAETIQAGAGS